MNIWIERNKHLELWQYVWWWQFQVGIACVSGSFNNSLLILLIIACIKHANFILFLKTSCQQSQHSARDLHESVMLASCTWSSGSHSGISTQSLLLQVSPATLSRGRQLWWLPSLPCLWYSSFASRLSTLAAPTVRLRSWLPLSTRPAPSLGSSALSSASLGTFLHFCYFDWDSSLQLIP